MSLVRQFPTAFEETCRALFLAIQPLPCVLDIARKGTLRQEPECRNDPTSHSWKKWSAIGKVRCNALTQVLCRNTKPGASDSGFCGCNGSWFL